MMSNNKRARAVFVKKSSVVATEIALAMLAAQIAYAQQPLEQAAPAAQPARTAAAEQVERIEITGTRIPQVNGRNLGPTRSRVLINGRRLPPGSPRSDPNGYAAALNQIPAPLIQRVELLTGGASAVYGSDAISGVVNFIMNDRFEGLQIDVDRSSYNHHQHNSGISEIVAARAQNNSSQFQVPGDIGRDGDIKNISLLMGSNFGGNKGNATLFFNYKQEAPVLQGSRDFSACALNPGGDPDTQDTTGPFTCGGSSTSFPGRFRISGTGKSFTVNDAAGNTRPFSAATDLFNFGPSNYYRRPSEQYAFSAFAHLDVAPKMRAYSEFQFHDNHTVAQIAPSGIFVGNPDFLTPNAIHFENP